MHQCSPVLHTSSHSLISSSQSTHTVDVVQGKEILNAGQNTFTLAGMSFEFQVELLMLLKAEGLQSAILVCNIF